MNITMSMPWTTADLTNLIQKEINGELSYGEFTDRFLPIWGDVGKDYRKRGLTDAGILELLRSYDPVMLTLDKTIEPFFLPETDTIELYRGANGGRPLGLSWTNDFDTAALYALGRGEFGAVATAQVPVEAIVSALEAEQRGDTVITEYLVDTTLVDPPDLTPVKDHRVLDAAMREANDRIENNRYPRTRVLSIRLRNRAMEYKSGLA